MAKYKYTEEQFKDFGDFYAYADVFNLHYVNIPEWKNGVALVELERGQAIFNGHNNKGYFFDEDKVPNEWIKDQFEKCATKYSCASEVANKIAEANIEADVARAKASTLDLELKRKRGEQEIENTKVIAQAQAEAIKQGKYAPVPNTVVVQDLKALGSVRDLMQPNE